MKRGSSWKCVRDCSSMSVMQLTGERGDRCTAIGETSPLHSNQALFSPITHLQPRATRTRTFPARKQVPANATDPNAPHHRFQTGLPQEKAKLPIEISSEATGRNMESGEFGHTQPRKRLERLKLFQKQIPSATEPLGQFVVSVGVTNLPNPRSRQLASPNNRLLSEFQI
jgi:hypothetical protein